MLMAEDKSFDGEALRERFPWFGLLEIDQPDLSARYREIMAEAQRDREIVETIESIRHSA
jgi:hypothetical protein